MKTMSNKISSAWDMLPSSFYLWSAIAIGAASSSLTRKIIEIGEQHFVNGRNPISLCNVLFVGNICAFIVLSFIFYRDWHRGLLKRLSRSDWISLVLIAILSGALAPALFFTALDNTTVTNVILIGRLEPILSLGFSYWLLGARVNKWTVAGSVVAFAGVAITALLGSSGQTITMMSGFIQLGKGEVQVAIAALISAVATILSKLRLQQIPLGFFTLFRTALGTVVFFVLANYLYGVEHFADAFSPVLWKWMLLYGTVIVVVGQLCWFTALRSSSSGQISLANSCNPLIAIAIAYLILREVPTTAQYLGGSIILVGIVLGFIGNVFQNKTPARLAKLTPGKQMEMTSGFRGI
jgi:drug/metabolite transporter (DMT)-like permease